jgi:hypothetical protein
MSIDRAMRAREFWRKQRVPHQKYQMKTKGRSRVFLVTTVPI